MEAFVRAFNAGDAKAVVADWTADGQYTDEDGNVFRGRDAIEKEYARLFTATPRDHRGEHRVAAVSGGGDRRGKRDCPRHAGRRQRPRRRLYAGPRETGGEMAAGRRRDPPYPAAAGETPWRIRVADRPMAAGFPDGIAANHFAWIGEKNFIKNTYRSGQREKTPWPANGSSAGTPSWAASSPGTSTPRAFRHRPMDQGRLEVGDRGQRRLCRRQRVLGRQHHHAAGRRQLHWQSTNRTLDGVRMPDVGPIRSSGLTRQVRTLSGDRHFRLPGTGGQECLPLN